MSKEQLPRASLSIASPDQAPGNSDDSRITAFEEVCYRDGNDSSFLVLKENLIELENAA